MTKKLSNLLKFALFGLLTTACILLSTNGKYFLVVKDGISLWIACILPSLFPYFFITSVLSYLNLTGKLSRLFSPVTKKLFNVNGSVGYAYFMSVLCGYPIGAKTVADLKNGGLLSDAESVRASALCSTCSPVFMIGSVGNIMFKSQSFGLMLFAVHLLSSIITGIIFSFYKRKDKPSKILSTSVIPSAKTTSNVLYESAYSAVISVLVVGGLITIFYLLTEMLYSLGILNLPVNLLSGIFKDESTAKAFTFGIFECTKGLNLLSSATKTLFVLPLACFMCSFGGLSIIAQSLAYLKGAKIKTAPFILSKIISAVIAFIIALIINLLSRL